MEFNWLHEGDEDEPVSQNTESESSLLADEGTSQIEDSVFDKCSAYKSAYSYISIESYSGADSSQSEYSSVYSSESSFRPNHAYEPIPAENTHL